MAESIAAQGGAIDFTAVSEWDLSAGQFRGVRFSTAVDNAVRVASVTGVAVIGVTQTKAGSGRSIRVRMLGITKGIAGAAITRGDRIDCDAQGYFRTAVGSNYAGYARETTVASATFGLVLNPQYTGAA
jgi:hypothetical protein